MYTALIDRATQEAAHRAVARAIWDKSAFNLREFADRLRPFVRVDWRPPAWRMTFDSPQRTAGTSS